jgi:hypothetical protein
LVMMPQRAYVDLPTQSVITLRGMRKYSTERASAKEFGGTMQTSPSKWTKLRSSNSFGSTIALLTLVKILNSSPPACRSRRGDAVGDRPLPHLRVLERLDHPVLAGHPADPVVGLDAHAGMKLEGGPPMEGAGGPGGRPTAVAPAADGGQVRAAEPAASVARPGSSLDTHGGRYFGGSASE